MNEDAPFSLKSYQRLVAALSDRGYRAVSFSSVLGRDRLPEMPLLLRHDIDFDLDLALPIAKADADQEFSSTFFVQVRSPLYNPLAAQSIDVLRRLGELGHRIGLHYDTTNGRTLADVQNDLEVLDSTGTLTERMVVSFHRPGTIEGAREMNLEPDLHHTYEPPYVDSFTYFSDSRARWIAGSPTASAVFERGMPLHVLTHPLWWQVAGDDAAAKLRTFVGRNGDRLVDRIERTAVSFKVGPGSPSAPLAS